MPRPKPIAEPLPLDTALTAWKTGRTGWSIINGFDVLKFKKMILVVQPKQKTNGRTHYTIIAFPKPEHVHAFKDAATGVKPFGPSHENPGGIGTATISVGPNDEYARLLKVQTHFRTQRNATGKPVLSNNLANKYTGWRTRAIATAALLSWKMDKPLFIDKTADRIDRQFYGIRQFTQELNKVIKTIGANVEETELQMIIRKPK